MKRLLLIITIFFIANVSFAQLSVKGTPKTFIHKDLAVLLTSIVEVEQPDLTDIINQDNDSDNMIKTRRFGVILPLGFDFFEKADYAEVDKGKLWVLRVKSNNAQALTLYSDSFYIPEGGELFIYNKNHSQVIGAFTSLNNDEYKNFASELVYGDEMVVEYYQPNYVSDKPIFNLSEIGYAYRDCSFDLSKASSEFGSSGSCNVNVNCVEGNNYRNAQRGVVRILVRSQNGLGWCSGSLINNATRDLAPYVLSAAHCIEGSGTSYYSSFVFYFNYESSSCPTTSIEPTSKTLKGTSVKAQGSYSDFVLFLLTNNVPQSYNAYWNGWNVQNTASLKGVAIHHPAGDIKKISTYITPLVGMGIPPNQSNITHWKAQWAQTQTNYGITEGGSSGCPLFNLSSQIVGTLTGGTSSCNALVSERNDYFGKMSYSWTTNGTTNSSRLKPWLDPQNTGVTQFRGDDYNTLAINEVAKTNDSYSKIYPNPAKNDINIILSPQKDPIQITIYDKLSRLILTKTIPSNTSEYSINAINFNAGYYIIKFNSLDKSWTDKLIISQ
ncbi:MAG: T9SS type A sorting domain-containing protein [Bacteroidales bacterium]